MAYSLSVSGGRWALVDRRKILKEFLVHDYPCCVPSGLLSPDGKRCKNAGPFDLSCDFAIDLDMCMRIAINYDFYATLIRCFQAGRYIFPVGHTFDAASERAERGSFLFYYAKDPGKSGCDESFPAAEHPKLIRDSIYFCTCRALLNGLAGLRARSGKLIRDTLWLIAREDPYLWNKLRIPWLVMREICLSFIPLTQ